MRSLLVFAAVPSVALAAPNTMITQGRLLDVNGSPLSGEYTMLFELHDDATADSPQWAETHDDVTVSDGYYAVEIGDTDPLDAAALGGERWLSVTVGSDELSRAPLTATPWAMRATALQLNPENAGVSPGVCSTEEVGTLRYNIDLDRLEFCRSRGGSPAWSAIDLCELCGDDTEGRRFTSGTTPDSCVAYRDDVRYSTTEGGTGAYWILPPGQTEEVKVWCDMDTESGGWLDVVASYHAPGADITALQSMLWSAPSGVTMTTIAATNSSAVDGVQVTTNQSPNHSQAMYLTPEVDYGAVRLDYRLQGANGGNRCGTSSWVPLSGPGFNGGYTASYLVSCAPGFGSCIQGSPQNLRDAPVVVTGYSTDSLSAATQHLAWSGSNNDGNSCTGENGCVCDSNIPTTQPALFVTKLLIR